MKKTLFKIFLLAITMCFIACKPSTGTDNNNTTENNPAGNSGSSSGSNGDSGGSNQISTTTYLGTKDPTEAKVIGDIIFTDGSSTTYIENVSFTEEQKSKVIAVIYKLTEEKAFGVGIKQSLLSWCSFSSIDGSSTNINAIQCTPTGSAGSLFFSGDTDGKDNFEKILEKYGDDEVMGSLNYYPAFEFAINYMDKNGSHVKGTSYESDWYLPTIAELFDIYKEKNTVDAALEACGYSKFSNSSYCYWSSSQSSSAADDAINLDFSDGAWYNGAKQSSLYVCCIREFN